MSRVKSVKVNVLLAVAEKARTGLMVRLASGRRQMETWKPDGREDLRQRTIEAICGTVYVCSVRRRKKRCRRWGHFHDGSDYVMIVKLTNGAKLTN